MLMVAMKLCSAQLRYQDGAMTARPHAEKGPLTGARKVWNVLTRVPTVFPTRLNSIKPNQHLHQQTFHSGISI